MRELAAYAPADDVLGLPDSPTMRVLLAAMRAALVGGETAARAA